MLVPLSTQIMPLGTQIVQPDTTVSASSMSCKLYELSRLHTCSKHPL